MSIRESIEIQCPKCGWKNETVIWSSASRMRWIAGAIDATIARIVA